MRKNRLSLLSILGVLIIISLLLPSCQSAASKQITIGYGSNIDPADIADLLGIDEFSKNHQVKVVEMTEDSGVVAGLIKGEIHIANIGLPDSIKAIQMGVPLKILFPANMVMEYVLIGQPGIKTVEDLKGKKVAYHAPGSGTEILPRMLVNNSGTITEPDVEWIILPESPNRAAAMQANRIDVTALEFADVLTLQESGKNYEVIASFADVAPEAIASVWVTTEDYTKTNMETLKEFAVAVAKGYDQATKDKNSWLTRAAKALPQVDQARVANTYDFYAKVHNFPTTPFFTQDLWDKMNAFYISAGEFEDPAPYDLVLTDAVKAAVDAMK